MSIAENIKLLRARYGLTQADLARIAGVSDKAISTWELGSRVPRMDTIEKIAVHFALHRNNLLEDGGMENSFDESSELEYVGLYNPTKRIPILGRIAAGMPMYAAENIEGYVSVDLPSGHEYFGLRVNGDSMNSAKINDGDVLIVRRQSDVDDGSIAAVLVNNSEATVKRIYRSKDRVTLMPQSTNPVHLPQIYDSKTEIIILGKVLQALTIFE